MKKLLLLAALSVFAMPANADNTGYPPGVWCEVEINVSANVYERIEERPEGCDNKWMKIDLNGNFGTHWMDCEAIDKPRSNGQTYICRDKAAKNLRLEVEVKLKWTYDIRTGMFSVEFGNDGDE